MTNSFVLNIGRGIELEYQTGPNAPSEYHSLNTENDLVIRGFVHGYCNGENHVVEDAGIYINRTDLLAFLNEVMTLETPAEELSFDDPAPETGFSDYCKISVGGVI